MKMYSTTSDECALDPIAQKLLCLHHQCLSNGVQLALTQTVADTFDTESEASFSYSELEHNGGEISNYRSNYFSYL